MFQIDALSRVPVYEQLVDQMEKLVLSGLLKAGDPMPSVRSLSLDLSINPNTIQKAYSELDRRGILMSVPGKGCFVAETATEVIRKKIRDKSSDLIKLVKDMKLAGAELEELLKLVRSAYEGNKEVCER
ncbi:MAG: GntR family transcriptional regulator [Lachnospiraceae bacterium]|nr:GntR family transcriptional regulator [Lachnospiraceae bacterium]